MRLTITRTILLVLLCLASTQFVLAQLSISGEIRPRAEFRDGFKTINTASQEAAFFVEQRSRLYLGYQNEKLGFQFSLQDVRIWGNTAQIYKSDPALTNVYEAWGEYKFNSNSSIRVGRQALNYDNARFLGNLDWAQQGRSHDAVKYMYQDSSGFSFHAGAAYNQNVVFEPGKLSSTYYEGINNYKSMQYLWLHKNWTTAQASLLLFNDGRQKTDSSQAFRQTYGFVGDKQLGNVKLGGELYYQGGKDQSGKEVNAWLVAVNVSINTSFTPLTFGVDYLSGTNPNENTNQAFNPSYGTNHKFYGFMDYFYVGNNHGQNGQTSGLLDFYVQSKFKLGERSALIAHFHHFSSPTSIYATEGTGEELSMQLGEEIDLVYNLNLTPEVNFKLGYSQLFSTESLEAIKGGAEHKGLNQWAWAMLSIKPTFYAK